MKVNRRFQVYVFHSLWLLFAGYRASDSISTMAKYSWIIVLALAMTSMLNVLLRRNYLEIIGQQLKINRDFFQTQTLELKDIVKIEIQPNPLVNSYILMKDGRKVKFNDSYVTDKRLKEVMGHALVEVS